MGIDIHCLNFLRYSRRRRRFDKTVTIGRQSVHITEQFARKVLSPPEMYTHLPYCEDMLQKYFGATNVDSIDNSNYEQATIIHDMNQPLPQQLYSSFDTMLDAGCLEHVYNIPQALRNCSLLCRPKGQIIHVLPANNFCGHGFWQFSPELFYSLYSSQHGYTDTEVYLADLADTANWFKVLPPVKGQRVNTHSKTQVYALVRTVLETTQFSHEKVQQSDYLYTWENAGRNQPASAQANSLKQRVKRSPILSAILTPPFQACLRLKNAAAGRKLKLSSSNPGLQKVSVSRVLEN